MIVLTKSLTHFLTTFFTIFESCFPIPHVTSNVKNSRCMTKGVRISCKHKESLYILPEITVVPYLRNIIDGIVLLRKIIREAKKGQYKNLLSSENENHMEHY